mgnify:FL=1
MKIVTKWILHPVALLILAGVLVGVAFADPTTDAPAPASAAPAAAPTVPVLPGDTAPAAPAPAAGAVTPAADAPPATAEALLAELKKLRSDYATYKSAESGGKKAALFALISAVALFLMRLAKAPLANKYGKSVVPKVALALGVAVGLFAALAAGQPVLDSVLYGAGPPLATFMHELMKKQPKTKEA